MRPNYLAMVRTFTNTWIPQAWLSNNKGNSPRNTRRDTADPKARRTTITNPALGLNRSLLRVIRPRNLRRICCKVVHRQPKKFLPYKSKSKLRSQLSPPLEPILQITRNQPKKASEPPRIWAPSKLILLTPPKRKIYVSKMRTYNRQ